jgi:hypothetical protein
MAELGRARSARIVEALDEFRRERGEYPQSLAELTPGFLSAAEISNQDSRKPEIEYRREEAQVFELSFSYTGPGRNTCVLRSDGPRNSWECYGYY